MESKGDLLRGISKREAVKNISSTATSESPQPSGMKAFGAECRELFG